MVSEVLTTSCNAGAQLAAGMVPLRRTEREPNAALKEQMFSVPSRVGIQTMPGETKAAEEIKQSNDFAAYCNL